MVMFYIVIFRNQVPVLDIKFLNFVNDHPIDFKFLQASLASVFLDIESV